MFLVRIMQTMEQTRSPQVVRAWGMKIVDTILGRCRWPSLITSTTSTTQYQPHHYLHLSSLPYVKQPHLYTLAQILAIVQLLYYCIFSICNITHVGRFRWRLFWHLSCVLWSSFLESRATKLGLIVFKVWDGCEGKKTQTCVRIFFPIQINIRKGDKEGTWL